MAPGFAAGAVPRLNVALRAQMVGKGRLMVMTMGRLGALRWLSAVALAAGAAGAAASPVWAQSRTSAAACRADSLVLVSPDSNSLRVGISGGSRYGVLLEWAAVPPQDATCAALVGADTLRIDLGGTYRDHVDRELFFNFSSGGVVGSRTQNRVVLDWVNGNISRTGRIEGQLNLSNTGGLLRLTGGGDGSWSRVNLGLPMSLPYTDILALAQAPTDTQLLLAHLGGKGLWRRSSSLAGWSRVGPSAAQPFTDDLVLTSLAFSPTGEARFAVGSQSRGFFVTGDGGQTFRQFGAEIDPSAPANPQVTALAWLPGGALGRLFVSIRNVGLFLSQDGGATFTKLANLVVPGDFSQPSSPPAPAVVNQIVGDPDDEQTVYFALKDYALYKTTDGGASWAPATGSWVNPGGVPYNGRAFARHPTNPLVLMVGTEGQGLWRSTNGGADWSRVASGRFPATALPPVTGLAFDPAHPGLLWAAVTTDSLLVSADDGATWDNAPVQPTNRQMSGLLMAPGGNDLFVPTYGGGIYVPGAPVALSASIMPITDAAYRNLDLGITLAFAPDSVATNTQFRLKCQDFQGYAVWRSEGSDPVGRLDLKLIGVYDKTNPQTCIEGYCGDQNYILIPGCFQERRAACFRFSEDGQTVSFFDGDIYNGFVYNYTVTTFDYGNIALAEPTSLTNDQLFSARYPGDPNSIFGYACQLTTYRVDATATAPERGPDIYCFPNPLRLGLGFTQSASDLLEGKQQVVFTNLPPDSRIRVYTEDGDLVAELPYAGEAQAGGNIYWDTRNRSGRQLASGIYFWRVEMPQREPYYGKLVIIR